MISINSVISSRDHRPFVQLKWGEQSCQLSTHEARQHAYDILDATNAAETDAIMVRFLKEKVGVGEDVDIALILKSFREFREGLSRLQAKDGQNRGSL